jgi:hypothetical protein
VPRTPGGRKPRHGGEFIFGDPASWGDPHVATTTETVRFRLPDLELRPRAAYPYPVENVDGEAVRIAHSRPGRFV